MAQALALCFAVGYSHPPAADLLAFTVEAGGSMTLRQAIAIGENPSTLCGDGGGRLYLGCENPGQAAIYRWQVRQDAAGGPLLAPEKRWGLPHGGLCHLVYHKELLLGSCYLDGVFFALDTATGKEVWRYRSTAAAPRAHWMTVSPDGRWLFACDLGADRIFQFPWRSGGPAPGPDRAFALRPGAGPRQALCTGRHLYVVGQDDSTLLVYDTESGRCLQRLPATREKLSGRNYPSVAFFTPQGELVLANRGADTLARFTVNRNGTLCFTREDKLAGRWPRLACPVEKGLVVTALRHSGAVHCYRLYSDGLTLCGTLSLPEASGLCWIMENKAPQFR